MHFENPPIVEAVIAFEVAQLKESFLDDSSPWRNQMSEAGYVFQQPITRQQVNMKIEGGTSEVEAHSPVLAGAKFASSDGVYAVQFNLDGFIFSRLGRYSTWEIFRDECRRIWSIYERASSMPSVLTYTVRYMNRLLIPLNESIDRYLQIYPRVPATVPNAVGRCFLQLELPIIKPKGKLVHQQILLPPEREGFSSVLFDNLFNFPALHLSNDAIWAELEAVRQVKDYYFEQFTTDEMRRTFNA